MSDITGAVLLLLGGQFAPILISYMFGRIHENRRWRRDIA